MKLIKLLQHVKKQQQPNYLFEQEELLNRAQVSEETDELFFEACEFVVEHGGLLLQAFKEVFKLVITVQQD